MWARVNVSSLPVKLYASAQVHRIPVVDNQAKLVGIVTRTDIFTALEGN